MYPRLLDVVIKLSPSLETTEAILVLALDFGEGWRGYMLPYHSSLLEPFDFDHILTHGAKLTRAEACGFFSSLSPEPYLSAEFSSIQHTH